MQGYLHPDRILTDSATVSGKPDARGYTVRKYREPKRSVRNWSGTLDALREGDTVVITELTRLGRSVKELFSIIERVHEAGALIKSLRETWLDATTPQGNLLFTIFARLSRFERDLITLRKAQLYSGRDIANSYCRTILSYRVFHIFILFYCRKDNH